jgi:hypothetical protein
VRLDALAERVRLVEARVGAPGRGAGPGVTTGWLEIDGAFAGAREPPGVPADVLHEWFAPGGPPVRVLSHVAACACRAFGGGLCAWIGTACWPYPRRLDAGLLSRSLFVDPPRLAERLWAIELCARSRAVAAVVADGSGLDDELRRPSAAAVRWHVEPAVSPTDYPRWAVELVRHKGLQPGNGDPPRWVLEGTNGAAVVLVPAGVADRPAAAPARPAATAGGAWKIA